MELKLKVADHYVASLLAYLKGLTEVEEVYLIEKEGGKRLSANDIEALIIKRAKANALKIGTGAMPSRPIEALFAELETE